MIAVLPPFMGQIVKFGCLVGLRASETIESVRLLNSGAHGHCNYYNKDRRCLEHFRFPEIFLRQTKKAYISFVTPEMIELIQNVGNNTLNQVPSLNAITLACRRKGIKMEMHLTRKIFASWLINKSGIDSTTVDMLQGRCPQSVLVRHYQTPESNLSSRILDGINMLHRAIEQ
jgi:intergrase/recombinase